MNRLAINLVVAIFAFILVLAGTAPAQSAESDIQQRLEQLEKEMESLKALLKQQQAEKERERAERQDEKKKLTDLEKKAKEPGFLSLKGMRIKPYGKVKLTMAYNDSQVSNEGYAMWALSEGHDEHVRNDDQFDFTAKETRLGFAIEGPLYNNISIRGQVEADFYGNATDQRKAEIMLRHAYLELGFPSFKLLAGQTWDVISPLNADSLNYSSGYNMGNIGYRHPQLRISRDFSLGGENILSTRLALALTEGVNTNLKTKDGNIADNKTGSLPTIQARMGYSTPMKGRRLDVGISGHYGEEEWDIGEKGSDDKFASWSVNADLTIPITSKLIFIGEFFRGANLDTYLGGIGQGVSIWQDDVNKTYKLVKDKTINSIGGWAEFSYLASEKLTFNVVGGIDDPDNGDLNTTNPRERNIACWANVLYRIIPPVTLGLEYMHIQTDYRGDNNDGVANRIQTSAIYEF